MPIGIVLYLLVVVPALATKLISYQERKGVYLVFEAQGRLNAWMTNEGWFGGCLIFLIVIQKDLLRTQRGKRTLRHELQHGQQLLRNGIFQLILYPLEALRIYFFQKNKHPYYDNKYEIECRKAAGQRIHIPKDQWKNGPSDRWIWW